MTWLDELERLEKAATEAPWFYLESKHGGLGVNHDEERVYAVDICGDPRCRDGSRWKEGMRRWSSHVVATIRDWAAWTTHPHDRDLIISLRNHAEQLIEIARAAQAICNQADELDEAVLPIAELRKALEVRDATI